MLSLYFSGPLETPEKKRHFGKDFGMWGVCEGVHPEEWRHLVVSGWWVSQSSWGITESYTTCSLPYYLLQLLLICSSFLLFWAVSVLHFQLWFTTIFQQMSRGLGAGGSWWRVTKLSGRWRWAVNFVSSRTRRWDAKSTWYWVLGNLGKIYPPAGETGPLTAGVTWRLLLLLSHFYVGHPQRSDQTLSRCMLKVKRNFVQWKYLHKGDIASFTPERGEGLVTSPEEWDEARPHVT